MKETNEIRVGEEAPDFTLPSHLGAKVTLSDFRGKKNVVLAFYPAAFTPVCTAQMPSYEEDLPEFERQDAQVLGISVDNVPCNKAWANSMGGISYPLQRDFFTLSEL